MATTAVCARASREARLDLCRRPRADHHGLGAGHAAVAARATDRPRQARPSGCAAMTRTSQCRSSHSPCSCRKTPGRPSRGARAPIKPSAAVSPAAASAPRIATTPACAGAGSARGCPPAAMAAHRVAARRGRADQVLALHAARGRQLRAARRSHQAALAHRARLPGTQAGGRAGTLRGARVARLPPPRHAVHRRLRLPDLREGGDSPLRTLCRPVAPDRAPETCHSRQLPTQRRRRSGPNGIFRTRSRQCDDASPSLSPGASNDARAATRRANRRTPIQIYDAVKLASVRP